MQKLTQTREKANHTSGIHAEVCWDYAYPTDERATAEHGGHGGHGGHGKGNGTLIG